MAKRKFYTARDIDPLIPKLEDIFRHMDVCRKRAETLATKCPQVSSATIPAEIVQVQLLRSQVDFLMQAVQDDINHILDLGGVTKDLDAGLVDFPGQMNGEEVWLCWKRGETKVRFWHFLDQGFAQRQILRRSDHPTTSH